MTFVRDILLLYNHGDEANTSVNGVWRDNFVKNFEFAYRKLSGNYITMDSANASLPDIQRQLIDSKVVFLLVDDPFLESNISDEILSVYAKNHISLNDPVYGYRKLLPIIASNFPREMYPEPVKNVIGYDFSSVRLYEKMVKEKKGSQGYNRMQQQMWMKIMDIAKDTKEILEFVDRRKRSPIIKEKTIYLAQTTPELNDIRDNVKRDLKRHGYIVLPDQYFTPEDKDTESRIGECLNASIMSIHLLGEKFGEMFSNKNSIVSLQHNLAEEHSARLNGAKDKIKFFRVHWINPDANDFDDEQVQFINRIKREIELREESELLQSPLEELKYFIRLQLVKHTKNLQKQQLTQTEQTDNRKSIYLIFDRKDYFLSENMKEFLTGHGFEVILPEFDGGIFELEHNHRKNLIHCDACMVIADQVSKKWINTKLRDIDKINGLGRNKPIQAKALYTTINGGQEKNIPINTETILISNKGQINAEVMKPFLHKFIKENE